MLSVPHSQIMEILSKFSDARDNSEKMAVECKRTCLRVNYIVNFAPSSSMQRYYSDAPAQCLLCHKPLDPTSSILYSHRAASLYELGVHTLCLCICVACRMCAK